MREDFLLLNPGPVPVARDVTKAMDRPMISRRSAEFGAVYERVREGLEYVFEHSTPDGSRSPATGEALLLNGTATMALEASIANLAADGSAVVLDNGAFGDRLRQIAELYADVTAVTAEWGESIDPAAVEGAVTDETDLVAMVHNETSTGLANPVSTIGDIAADHDALFLVDGVSSVGGVEFRFDEWHVDVAVTDPQKALASPPGISALFASGAAIEAVDGRRSPFYLSLADHLSAAEESRTPYTCASPLVRALEVALDRIEREGMADRIERHRRYAASVRAGMEAMGLSPFAEPDHGATYSDTLSAIAFPDGADPEAFARGMDERGVSVGGGIGHLDGELFRVSNMGELTPDLIVRGVYSVGVALDEAGADVDVEAGLRATESIVRGERAP